MELVICYLCFCFFIFLSRDLITRLIRFDFFSCSSARFEGSLNMDLNEIAMNLVPFPHLHYLVPSLTPLYTLADVNIPPRRFVIIHFQSFLPSFTSSALTPAFFTINSVLALYDLCAQPHIQRVGFPLSHLNVVEWTRDAMIIV